MLYSLLLPPPPPCNPTHLTPPPSSSSSYPLPPTRTQQRGTNTDYIPRTRSSSFIRLRPSLTSKSSTLTQARAAERLFGPTTTPNPITRHTTQRKRKPTRCVTGTGKEADPKAVCLSKAALYDSTLQVTNCTNSKTNRPRTCNKQSRTNLMCAVVGRSLVGGSSTTRQENIMHLIPRQFLHTRASSSCLDCDEEGVKSRRGGSKERGNVLFTPRAVSLPMGSGGMKGGGGRKPNASSSEERGRRRRNSSSFSPPEASFFPSSPPPTPIPRSPHQTRRRNKEPEMLFFSRREKEEGASSFVSLFLVWGGRRRGGGKGGEVGSRAHMGNSRVQTDSK